MTKQKSKEKSIMDNMVQECKNSYQSIKMSSLSEEAKDKIIKILREERKKRFSKDDYQTILEKVKEEREIPANELYEIVNNILNDYDLGFEDLTGYDTFLVYAYDYLNKEFGKTFTKKFPKDLKILKENLVPFDITDDEFATFLVGGKDCLTYKGQKLNLGYKYDKLLKDKEEIEEKITNKIESDVKNNQDIKELGQKIIQLEKDNMHCRAENPNHCEGFCEKNNEKIKDHAKKIEIEKEKILHKVKEEFGYDELIAEIREFEKKTFEEKYPYMEDFYKKNILPIEINIFINKSFNKDII